MCEMLMGKIVAHLLVHTAVNYLRTEAVSAIIFITYTAYGLRLLQKAGHLRIHSNLQFEELLHYAQLNIPVQCSNLKSGLLKCEQISL